jgi:hypothetical protein
MSTWEEPFELLAREGRIADAVVEYIRAHGSVTFVELENRFEQFLPVRGPGHQLPSEEVQSRWPLPSPLGEEEGPPPRRHAMPT